MTDLADLPDELLSPTSLISAIQILFHRPSDNPSAQSAKSVSTAVQTDVADIPFICISDLPTS